MNHAGALRSSSGRTLPDKTGAAYRSVRRDARGRVVIRLWLPLTLLWIVLAPFALVAAPALMLAPGRPSPYRTVWAVGRLLLALSGTLIDVESPAAVIRIHIV